MPPVPAPLADHESQALGAARQWVARCLEPGEHFGGLAPLDPDAGHVVLRGVIKDWAVQHPLNAAEVCGWARAGWGDADLAARELIAEFLNIGVTLPLPLNAYMIDLAHPRAEAHQQAIRGQPRAKKLLEDLCIAVLLAELCRNFGLRLRRRQKHTDSACSVVARALNEFGINRAERAIEKVSEHYAFLIIELARAKQMS